MLFSRRAIASFGAALMLGGTLGFAQAGGPSFDCRKAQLPTEKAICSDPKMSAIDVLSAKAFTTFQPDFADKHQIARSLIADRNACQADAACIVSVQSNALETFGTAPPWVQNYNTALIGKKALDLAAGASDPADQPLPSSIGKCSFTHIATLTARIGDDPLATASPEAGSAATFTNGGTAVSYDREPGLVNASVGDPVVMCLISIPRDCPQGDTRGRVYYAVDLARKGTWSLPDSQHMCGGA